MFTRQEWRSAAITFIVVVGWMSCANGALAQAASSAQRFVIPAHQVARDNDRIEILRQELYRSETLLEALAHRMAERLAASDATGAADAEEQLRRTREDIVGLQRELAIVTRPAGSKTSGGAVAVPRATPTASPSATPPTTPRITPWWDVYGKGRRADPVVPVSVAPPPEQAVRTVSARRLE
ncbi:hypothetical protein QTH97_24000 [Variovorax sp. J22R24]|uniref:hypothetical protein n=1 Tax=Variovorax gracilis TaxID=3053502 RepID=UPI002578C513|nr:hypothetical protein [Variovorax sp. J22R24]MDM0108033.1 hypothetical protein [Variovorax sp. J22R24]